MNLKKYCAIRKTMADLFTLKTITKTPQIIALFGGGFSVILGFVVIVSWHIHFSPLIQVLPNSPPMRYNTALAFFLNGWVLLALIRKWRRLAAGLSLVVALIGSLTLAQYIFPVNFGIDQLFIQDYLTNSLPTSSDSLRISEPIQQFLIKIDSPLPGRPSLNTALGFTLLAIGSLCLSLVKINRRLLIIAGLSSAGAIAIGFVALFGYISGVGTTYKWGYLTGVAVPTAVSLLSVGVSLQLLAIERVDRLPKWFPLNIGFGILTANVFLWQTIYSWKNILIKQLSNITDEVELLLTPIAQLVLLQGVFVSLLVMLILYFGQLNQKQTARLKLTNYDLIKSNSLLQATLESTTDGIFVLDVHGQKINFNTKFIEMWQVPDSVIKAMRWGQEQSILLFIANQFPEPEVFLEATNQMLNRPEEETYNVWQFADGRVLELYTRPQWISDRPIGRVFSFRDITKRRQAEAALKESEERLQLAMEGSGDGLWDWKILTNEVYLSDRYVQMLGYSIEELPQVLSTWEQLIHPEDQPWVTETLNAHLQDSESPYNFDYRVLTKSGEWKWIANYGKVVKRDEDGKPLRMTGTHRDISLRKQIETALEKSEELYRSVITAMSEGIVLQDTDGEILASNLRAEEILGLSLDQMMRRTSYHPCWQAIHEDGSPFPGEQHPVTITLLTGEPCRNVMMGIHKPDGKLTWISVNSQPLFYLGESRPYAAVASFSDITERHCAEEQLRFLKTIAFAIAESPDFDSALAQVLQLVCQTSGWDYGEAWIPCTKNHILQSSSAWYINDHEHLNHVYQIEKFRAVSETFTFALGVGLPGRVWASQQPEWQEDTSKQPETIFLRQDAALENDIKAGLGIPVVVNQEVLAVLVFFKFTVSTENKQMVESISAIAAQLGLLLQRKQMEEELFHEKEFAQVTLHSIGDGVIATDAIGKIEYFNPVAEMLTGWSQQEVKGLPLREVFRIFHETTREPAENPVEKALRSGEIVGLANHTVLITRDDREIAIDDSAAPIRDRQNQIVGAVMVFHDCTQNRSLSRQITWQASHDSLTGLANRHEFEQCLEQAVNGAKKYNLEHALCYLDLDQFKIVNDTCGHAAGDELLRQVTTVLQTKIRQTDILARLGGDEFGALLYQCSLDQAIRVAEVLRKTIQEFRFVWQDNIFSIGVSIGLVEINANSENRVSLLSSADAACYAAKNKGRNRVHVFQSDDEELLQQRGEMQWVSRITKALAENRFCLYSQTIVAIAPTATEEIHCEILLRLRDEEGNLIAPMAFIPAAERYNLMPTIDRWVIKTLFKSWVLGDKDSKTIYAINLSGTTINDDQFISFLREQFSLYKVPPQSICFEITETVAIANLTKACQFISELQRYGCRFSLDDFGSGMSSFAYLKTLPVDYLKIDGGFIKNIIENSVDDAMVEAIARIGHVMGVKTIAEFVENDAILQRIKALGVDYAQGYGVAKPCPLVFA
jgi:diguanylate cyclase (GGDEF)-like protein/PAS domain S-box-containing protein